MRLFKKVLASVLGFSLAFSSAISLHIFAGGESNVPANITSKIPADLKECCLALDERLRYNDELKKRLVATSDRDLGKFHMGLGLWIRNSWLYPCVRGRISKLLWDNGCDGADDMSNIIIRCYRHYLLTGELETDVADLVIDYEFDCLSRFDKSITRESVKDKLRKRIADNTYCADKSSWWCTIM